MRREESLSELRQEIEETTRAIFSLIARRLEIAREIARVKARKGIRLHLPGQERELRDRLSRKFKELDVNNEFGNRILDELFAESRKVQAELRKRLNQRPDYERQRRAVIIGGAGSMGIWLAGRLVDTGFGVTIFDSNLNKAKRVARSLRVDVAHSLRAALQSSEMVILSVPLREAIRTLPDVVRDARKNSVVVEICSLKSAVHRKLREIRRKDLTLVSLHPLFGPRSLGIANKTIALCPVRDLSGEIDIARELFREARIIRVGAEVHDIAMGTLLSLTHLAGLAFTATSSTENAAVIRNLATTSFTLQLLAAISVLLENPDVFVSILFDNQETVRVLEKYQSNIASLKRIIRKKDANGLRNELLRVRRTIANLFQLEELYRSSGRILEVVRPV